jgi:hypothetical protein
LELFGLNSLEELPQNESTKSLMPAQPTPAPSTPAPPPTA